MYRRPLPATNLEFLSTLMWDGRESTPPTTQKITYPNTGQLLADLAHQAMDATTGHAQGAVPTPAQIQDIVSFEAARSRWLRNSSLLVLTIPSLQASGSIPLGCSSIPIFSTYSMLGRTRHLPLEPALPAVRPHSIRNQLRFPASPE
jgi:hypothetical protein